jgi:hypothetical protein
MALNSDRFGNSSHFGLGTPSDLAAAQDTAAGKLEHD